MKRLILIILIILLIPSFAGCGKNDIKETTSFSSEAETSEATENQESTSETESESQSESAPAPEPMDKIKRTTKAIYGKDTGSDKTFTGLEPLPTVNLPVVDPDNLKCLSTTPHNHSFGVSKNGIPHEISVNNQKFYEKYGAICLDTKGEKVIYLTFDCGYENGCTEKILDTLKSKKVPAAFFVTLPNVKDNPQIIARMINEGHIVGNHTMHHYDMSKLTDKESFSQELTDLEKLFLEITGKEMPKYYRPPQGVYSQDNLIMARDLGYKTVFWSLAYVDWNNDKQPTADHAFSKLLPRIHNGAVVLLHSTSQTNAEILDELLTLWEQQGYTFYSIDRLFS